MHTVLDNAGGKPFECGMGNQMNCLSLIGIWGAGAVGQCLNNELGFRMGPGGFKYAVLQVSKMIDASSKFDY